MDTPIRLAPQHEVDKEMADYFRREAERVEEERKQAAEATRTASELPLRTISLAEAVEKVRLIRLAQKRGSTGAPASCGAPAGPERSAPCAATSREIAEEPDSRFPPSPAPSERLRGSPPAAPSSSTSSDDCFPVAGTVPLSPCTDPLGELTELCSRVARSSDYRRERARYCELSIQLNVVGYRAPAFRPRADPGAKLGDPVHMLIHRDQMVIDYHWCYATRMEMAPSDPKHAALLDLGSEFSFSDAWTLANKRWRGRYRAAEALGLTTFQQCQTVCLRGPELIEKVLSISSGYRDSGGKFSSRQAVAMRKIREWIEKTPRMRAERGVYECLWIARELLGATNEALIPQLVALMVGDRTLDRRTIRGKLKTLDKYVQL